MQPISSSVHAERVADDVFVAPQLTVADMQAVAAAGFRSVINNRPDLEGGDAQPASTALQAAAQAAGLAYRHHPVPPGGHTEDQARRMVELVEELPKPVLAFCRSGRRSAALYALGARNGGRAG